jgi:uncharacterized protein YlxW (UPF0749 family)
MPHRAPARRSRAFLGVSPTTWSLLVPVVALLAGALFATSSTAAQGGSLRYDNDTVADLIRRGTAENEQSSEQLTALQAEVDELTRTSTSDNAEIEALKARADALAPEAGRTPVTGPALTVTLNDSKLGSDELPDGFTVDDIVVHQQDVQAVVNALWANGAEAMMLMDQRVITTSAVRCVGNTLILQGRVYSPPYVISAIGDVPAMRKGLDADKQVRIYREYVSAVGLGYQVRTQASASFPGYVGSITPVHAVAAS